MMETFEVFFGATLGISAGVMILLVGLLGMAAVVGKIGPKK